MKIRHITKLTLIAILLSLAACKEQESKEINVQNADASVHVGEDGINAQDTASGSSVSISQDGIQVQGGGAEVNVGGEAGKDAMNMMNQALKDSNVTINVGEGVEVQGNKE